MGCAVDDALDRATLTGSVTSLEEHADAQPFVHDPLLKLDELSLQPVEVPLVLRHAQGRVTAGAVVRRMSRSHRRRLGPDLGSGTHRKRNLERIRLLYAGLSTAPAAMWTGESVIRTSLSCIRSVTPQSNPGLTRRARVRPTSTWSKVAALSSPVRSSDTTRCGRGACSADAHRGLAGPHDRPDHRVRGARRTFDSACRTAIRVGSDASTGVAPGEGRSDEVSDCASAGYRPGRAGQVVDGSSQWPATSPDVRRRPGKCHREAILPVLCDGLPTRPSNPAAG